MVIKNASDFIGEALGTSEAKTRAILFSTIGKVLIIDEAYALCPGASDGGGGGSQDNFRIAVLDTLVAEIQGNTEEDRCVLLLGYERQMKELFRKANEGLVRRFNSERPFRLGSYTLGQLMQILKLRMQEQQVRASSHALGVAKQVLGRESRHPLFNNAAAVDTCLQEAKRRRDERLKATPEEGRDYTGELQPEDFDPDHGIKEAGYTDCKQLLKGLVGDGVILTIDNYQKQALMAQWSGQGNFSDMVPTNFVFKGEPGKSTPSLLP